MKPLFSNPNRVITVRSRPRHQFFFSSSPNVVVPIFHHRVEDRFKCQLRPLILSNREKEKKKKDRKKHSLNKRFLII